MTPWELHYRDWSNCKRCPLHLTRRNVVLARGNLPCEVLFIGEAPGTAEDVDAQPFVGPAGRLLNQLIEKAMTAAPRPLSTAFTNLVGCIPMTEGYKEEPGPSEIKACQPRLFDLAKMAQPKLTVLVGKLAGEYVMYSKLGPWRITVTHPSAILRANAAQKDMMARRVVATLANAFERIDQGEQQCLPG